MSTTGPPLPDDEAWHRAGVAGAEELHAGKQSRVFAASLAGTDVVVKLTDRRACDRATLSSRMEAVLALARELPVVVAPVRLDDELIRPIADWWMTATPFVAGGPLDVTDPGDAHLMGVTLAHLHEALARLPVLAIPTVAALDAVPGVADRTGRQLLHGDFSDQNVLATSAGLRVLDFDDCGYGPVEYDVANSLYMVLFDAEVTSRPDQYEAFRPPFLRGYAHGAGRELADAAVDALIGARITALGCWLDDLPSAPIGIRTSSPAWLDTLRSFVRSHGPSAR
ncbi:MAG: phosphotransferase [Actinomycetota bacterium]|nr:phosphotransferase [Actinomycetota bacterium]